MNFSGISEKTFVGKASRYILGLLPKQMKMPIMQGTLSGKKWIVGSSNHGCWLGSYEIAKQRLFSVTVASGSVVYDIGGHVGFYTLLASVRVGTKGRVFVFEPLPRNLHYLHQHLSINRIENATVIEAAVSNKIGAMRFAEGSSSTEGSLNSNGHLNVKVVSLDDLHSRGELPLPDVMKIDIEGGEYLALRGAERMITESHPAIFLATHGDIVHRQCCEFLRHLGYQLQSIDRRTVGETDELIAVHEPK